MFLVSAWARAFAVTTLVELVAAVPQLGKSSWLRRSALVMFAQMISHPAVWFIFPELHLRRFWFLVCAETWACAIEALFYKVSFPELRWSRAFGVSLFANAASVLVGLALKI